MGLGKTIQIIVLLLLRQKNKKSFGRPSLLVVPASLLGNWQSEIERFVPGLKCLYLHRSMMDGNGFGAMADTHQAEFAASDAVLTTYAMFSRQLYLIDYQWDLAVIDEAQAIKNPGSKQSINLKKIKARVFQSLVKNLETRKVDQYKPLRALTAPYILRRLKTDKSIISDLPDKTEVTACWPSQPHPLTPGRKNQKGSRPPLGPAEKPRKNQT